MRDALICPLCGRPLGREGSSLRCDGRHTFDIARQGYVNLLTKKPDTIYEDRALFAARRRVYAAGFFDPLMRAVSGALPQGRILDAGCGEGSLLAALLADGHREGAGLDIARPAVQLAAGAHKGPVWLVADLCNIPLADASVDGIANVLTPANYAQFARVLRPGGLLVKAVPGAEHLAQIREATGKQPYARELSDTLRALERLFTLERQEAVRYMAPCTPALAADVYAMTPLTAHEARPEGALPSAVTVDVTLLVARVR